MAKTSTIKPHNDQKISNKAMAPMTKHQIWTEFIIKTSNISINIATNLGRDCPVIKEILKRT